MTSPAQKPEANEAAPPAPAHSSTWHPLSDAGEALRGLATAALNAAPAPPTPANVQPVATVTDAPDARPPSPSGSLNASPFAHIATSHPYSTVFLMGAGLTASALAGGMAARVAMGRVGARAGRGSARSLAPHAGGGGTGGGSAGGVTASASASRITPEVEKRLARLEALVRELAAEQRNALAKVTAAQAAAVERLDALDRSETHMDAVALVEGAVGQLESRLDTLDDLVSKVESGQSRFSAELTKLDDGIAGRLAEIGVANTEVLDRQSKALAALEERLNEVLEKTPTVASLLAKMPKDAGKRSQVLMGELLAAVRRLSGAAADEKPGTTEPSINDLATEGLPPSAADPVSSKEDIRPSTSQGASPHASDAAKEAESKATPSKKTKKAATSTSTNPSAATATDSQSPTTEAPPASPHKIDDMSRALLRKILARQPVKCFGIDDTGEWRFAIETGVTPTLIACGVPHMYQQLITLGQVPRAGGTWVRSEFEFSQFTTVMVYEGGVVDIIFLDGAWWRCSKEGKLYTIRDRLVVL